MDVERDTGISREPMGCGLPDGLSDNSEKTLKIMAADKNTLIPIKKSNSGFGQYDLALLEHNHRYMHLPKTGYILRSDIDGLILDQDGRPAVQPSRLTSICM